MALASARDDRERLEVARRAVEVADASGDRHLFHRRYGVLSHAYIVRGADAHLQARLGNFGRALTLMKRAYVRLLAHGLPREAVYLGQLRCRRPLLPWGGNWRDAADVLQRCLDQRPDLPDAHRDGMADILRVLDKYPESAFDQLVELRGSFIAPVPGVMVERIDRRSTWD